jgi:DNA invertase Pin-like site-specific DNA recombinase
MPKYVLYYRVGKNLSLDEQRQTAREFVALNQGEVVGRYTEEETDPWPELRKAIACSLKAQATFVIVLLGRLIRNMSFTTILQDSAVEFVACDAPNANNRTVHIMAALAEDESLRVRERTKKGLAAAKAKGVKLGSNRPGHWKGREHRRGWRQAVAGSIAARRTRTAEAYAYLLPEIKTRRERGDTLPEIIKWLNDAGYTTTAGKPFTQTALWRIIGRYLGKEYLGNNTRKFAKQKKPPVPV